MKKALLLFSTLFLVLSVYGQALVVTGVVARDIDSMPSTDARVLLYSSTDTTNSLADAYTDTNGVYLINLTSAQEGNYIVKTVDECGTEYSQSITYALGDSAKVVNFFVKCANVTKVGYALAEISGNVSDLAGHPFDNVDIGAYLISKSGDQVSEYHINTDPFGNYVFYIRYTPETDSVVDIKIMDNCGVEYKDTVNLVYDGSVLKASKDFTVKCGWKDKLFISGQVLSATGSPLPLAGVKAYYLKDLKTAYANTNEDGLYMVSIPYSVYRDDTLFVSVTDTTGKEYSQMIIPSDTTQDYQTDITIGTAAPLRFYSIYGDLAGDNSAPAKEGNAANLTVVVYKPNAPQYKAYARTDNYGKFQANLLTYADGDTISAAVVGCDGVGQDLAITADMQYIFFNFDATTCPDSTVPDYVDFDVVVYDTAGNPAPGVRVFVSRTYIADDFVFQTDEDGEAKFSLPVPLDTLLFRLGVEDYCHTIYDTVMLFDWRGFEVTKDFKVDCGQPIMVTVEGVIATKDSIPMSGARIEAYLNSDYNDKLYTVANPAGFYRFTAEAPMDGDTATIRAIDSCGNVDSVSFIFHMDNLYYRQDIYSAVLTCPRQKVDTVIYLSGRVLDTMDNPVENMIIGAHLPYDYETSDIMPAKVLMDKSKVFFGVTDKDGYYTVKMPLLAEPDSIYVETFDDCGNYYGHAVYFDFSQFRYNGLDFDVACPPQYDSIKPSLAIGMEEDWNDYTEYVFYAYLMNVENSPMYFIWHIGEDTVVTNDPELDYVFNLQDTCVDVYVEAMLAGNLLMTSDPITVCVYNPFEEFGMDCYADFIYSFLDSTASRFAEFYPFVAADTGMVPVSARWDFGDGTVLDITDTVDKVVRHEYKDAGEYWVTYDVTFRSSNGEECTANWEEPIWTGTDVWYPDSCAAVFYVAVDSENTNKIYFQDISYPGDTSSIQYYYWDFGDGQSSTASSPVHTYDSSGSYLVSMEIITTSGCYDEFEMMVEAGADLYPILFYPDTVGGNSKGYGVKFHNISKTKSDKWTWDFGEEVKGSLLKTSSDTVIHYYADTGYYTVKLIDNTTGAGFSMKIHVTSADQVQPVSGALIAATAATPVQDAAVEVDKLALYPNPVQSTLNIKTGRTSGTVNIEIYTVTGQLVKRVVAVNTDKVSVNVKDLASGSYFVKVIYDGSIGIGKFVKQ